jgi:uncharacterized integral membrane protein
MKYIYYRLSGGILLIVVGLFIWLSNLDVFDITWRRDWPVILIIIGVLELIKHIVKKR